MTLQKVPERNFTQELNNSNKSYNNNKVNISDEESSE